MKFDDICCRVHSNGCTYTGFINPFPVGAFRNDAVQVLSMGRSDVIVPDYVARSTGIRQFDEDGNQGDLIFDMDIIEIVSMNNNKSTYIVQYNGETMCFEYFLLSQSSFSNNHFVDIYGTRPCYHSEILEAVCSGYIKYLKVIGNKTAEV